MTCPRCSPGIRPHAVLIGVAFFAFMGGGRAADPPRQWALVIACKDHKDPQLNLLYTQNDAERIVSVLKARAGLPDEQILALTDATGNAGHSPTLSNLRRTIPEFLNRPGEDDSVFVFFAGHGFLDGGKTFLVAKDTAPDNLAATALPASELKSAIQACKAKVKLLVLDCCHAGGTRAVGMPEAVDASQMARSAGLNDLTGVVVLGGCTAEQKSFEAPDLKQGVFSYWLARGLSGAADKDADGVVDVDELYKFAYDRVRMTVGRKFGAEQTPVRVIGADVPGVAELITLQTMPPEEVCRTLAEDLYLEILDNRKLKSVAVLDFAMNVNGKDELARVSLPGYCAAQVRAELTKLADDRFDVAPAAATQAAAGGLNPDGLGDPAAMAGLSQAGKRGTIDAAVAGSLSRRGTKLVVQCELIRTADGESLIRPSRAVPLTEELLGDLGGSFANVKRPAGSPGDKKVLDAVDDAAAKPHPQSVAGQKTFPCAVRVYAVELTKDGRGMRNLGEKKPIADKANGKEQLVIQVQKGELLCLHLGNKHRNAVAATVLVDGLNTLTGRPGRLGQDRAYVIPSNNFVLVQGWSDVGANKLTMFKVTDVSASVAGRQNYGQQLGLITVGFYADQREKDEDKAVGIGEGPEFTQRHKEVDFQLGRLLGVVNIRYVADE